MALGFPLHRGLHSCWVPSLGSNTILLLWRSRGRGKNRSSPLLVLELYPTALPKLQFYMAICFLLGL